MKKYLALSLLLFFTSVGFSQTYLISSYNGQTVNTCSGHTYDSGGAGGGYGNNQNLSMTIHSNNATSTHIRLFFFTFDVDPSDTLYIYDGPNITSPLLGAYNNTNSINGTALYASVLNGSGSLTLKFKSNGAAVGPGWDAEISCSLPCQTVIASIDSVASVPHVKNNLYLDICNGDTITFVGTGTFPQNNIIYGQSNATSTFAWDFGDGTTATGQIVSHVYSQIRGYNISLQVTDTMGCINMNSAAYRVRISNDPIGHMGSLPDICSGTDLNITVGYSSLSNVTVTTPSYYQSASLMYDSATFIPDGGATPTGTGCYNTYVTFSCFNPGQTVNSVNDIVSVEVNMEHSYVGDLDMTLVCPNGQQSILRSFTHAGGSYLGIPLGGDGHHAFDCNSPPSCLLDPTMNPPGTGWTYMWTMNNPQFNTITTYQSTGNTTPLPPGIGNPMIDSGSYTPDQSFANLIGCPLNGTWNFKVCDSWASDNGWVFWWKLNLDPNILPVNWGYTVPIDTVIWTGPFITSNTNTKLTIHPDTGGIFNYHVDIIDVFGCSYDTLVPVTVVTTPVVNLGPDTNQCAGAPIVLTAPNYPNATYYWLPSGDTTQSITVNTTQNYVAILQTGNGNVMCMGQDTIHVGFFPRPLINFMPDTMEGCVPVVVHFANGSLPANASFSWDFGDGNFSTTASPTHSYTQDGTFNVTLTATTGEGCQESYTVPNIIKAYIQPIANFTTYPDLVNIQNPNVTFTNTSQNGNNPFWKFGDGNTSTEENPLHTFNAVGAYDVWLIYQTEHGCIDSIMKSVTVIDDSITIPNVITPNGDGKNDYFKVYNIEAFLTNELIVYDRWGKKVFEKLNYRNDWDGGNLSDGTYYIIIRGHGLLRDVEYKGTLTIIGK